MYSEPIISADGERGVSAVVGVILMVAVTVILAAAIGALVLDLGSETDTTPQAGVSITETGDSVDITTITGDTDLDEVRLQVNGHEVTTMSVGESRSLSMEVLGDGDEITVLGASEDGELSPVATHTVSKPDNYTPPEDVDTPDVTPVWADRFVDADGDPNEGNENASLPPTDPIGDVEGFNREEFASEGGSATITEAQNDDNTFEMNVGGVARGVPDAPAYTVEFWYQSEGAGVDSTLAITDVDGNVLDSIHLEEETEGEDRVFHPSPEAVEYISDHGRAYFVLSENPDYSRTTFDIYSLRIYPE